MAKESSDAGRGKGGGGGDRGRGGVRFYDCISAAIGMFRPVSFLYHDF